MNEITPEAPPKVKVLNGEVGPGDRVAYAAQSRSMADLRWGTVLELVEDFSVRYWRSDKRGLKIHVEGGSTAFGGYPYTKTVDCFDRMMKL